MESALSILDSSAQRRNLELSLADRDEEQGCAEGSASAVDFELDGDCRHRYE